MLRSGRSVAAGLCWGLLATILSCDASSGGQPKISDSHSNRSFLAFGESEGKNYLFRVGADDLRVTAGTVASVEFCEAASAPNCSRIVVGDQWGDLHFYLSEPSSLKLLREFELPEGEMPGHVWLDPLTNLVYTTVRPGSSAPRQVLVIDMQKGEIRTRIYPGKMGVFIDEAGRGWEPSAFHYDASTRRVYLTSDPPAWLDVDKQVIGGVISLKPLELEPGGLHLRELVLSPRGERVVLWQVNT